MQVKLTEASGRMFSLSHIVRRTQFSHNGNELVQFHPTQRGVTATQFNYSATRRPSEWGRNTQEWLLDCLVSGFSRKPPVIIWLCETGLDVGAMIMINSHFIQYITTVWFNEGEKVVKKTETKWPCTAVGQWYEMCNERCEDTMSVSVAHSQRCLHNHEAIYLIITQFYKNKKKGRLNFTLCRD